jgi:hypothetical protein
MKNKIESWICFASGMIILFFGTAIVFTILYDAYYHSFFSYEFILLFIFYILPGVVWLIYLWAKEIFGNE